MRCPNCNNENEAGSKFCIHCGSTLPQEETVVQQEQVNENVVEPVVAEPQVEAQPVVENNVVSEPVVEQAPQYQPVQQPVQPQQNTVAPNATNTQTAQNKQRRSLITILLVGVVALVLLVAISVVALSGGSQKLYKTAIKKGLDGLFNAEGYDAKSVKSTAVVEVSATDSQYDTIDGLKANANIQLDLEKQQALVKVGLDQKKDSYLDLNLYADLKDKKAYAQEKNLFKKVIGIDIPDEFIDEMNEVINLDELSSKKTSKERKVMAKSFEKAINKNLSSKNFSKETVKVTISGKEKKVKDNVLTLTESQLKKFITNFATDLKEDKDFMEAYKSLTGETDTITDALDELLDSAESLADEDAKENPNQVQVHYYTSGMGNKFVGLGLIALSEGGEDSVAVEVMQSGKNEYTFGMSQASKYGVDQEENFVVTINKLKLNDIDVECDLNQVGVPVKVKLKTNVEYNKGIDSFDTSKAININDLTEDDLEEIMENLEASPLYNILSSLDLDDIVDEIGGSTSSSTVTQKPTTDKKPAVDVASGEGYIRDYSNKKNVVYKLPSRYEESEYSDDTYRFYYKDGSYSSARVVIDLTDYDTAKEFLEDQKDSVDYVIEDEDDFYHDVKVSNIEKEKINGVEFQKITITYKYGSTGSVRKIGYVTELGNGYIYTVEIEDDGTQATDSEIKDFLTINVK